jgi:CHAT domain-containing protein
LPPNSVLIDFVQYRRYEPRWTGQSYAAHEQRYAAYLTFPLVGDSADVLVERIDLGEAAPIDDAVGVIAKRFAVGQYRAKDLSPAFQRLSELVYVPLSKHLTNVSHLITCPDGQLNRIPFEMLPVGRKFLLEEKTISYVTSAREIVRLGAAQSKPKSGPEKELLVMGNPDFDLDLSKNEALPKSAIQLADATTQLRSLSRDYRGLKFKPLPNAEAEARSVAKLLGKDTVLRVGAEARERELKAVQSPRVLHLATHGFFLSDQKLKQTNPTDWNSQFAGFGPSTIRTAEAWENPLTRCGIALAGANHAQQISNAVAEDGVLTGLEASLLDLQGTELVILSACDSGSGEVKNGEGVISLQRAFRIAGAETVLASHWKVNDKATDTLMTEFIRRWRAGEQRADAWREAQLSLLHSKDFSNPFFWAAFTLTGQWR